MNPYGVTPAVSLEHITPFNLCNGEPVLKLLHSFLYGMKGIRTGERDTNSFSEQNKTKDDSLFERTNSAQNLLCTHVKASAECQGSRNPDKGIVVVADCQRVLNRQLLQKIHTQHFC